MSKNHPEALLAKTMIPILGGTYHHLRSNHPLASFVQYSSIHSHPHLHKHFLLLETGIKGKYTEIHFHSNNNEI